MTTLKQAEKRLDEIDKRAKPPRPNPATLEQRTLAEAKYFGVLLTDGSRLECKLLEFGTYHLKLEVDSEHFTGVVLLPKHSVKYFILAEE